jgi:hypothetical protein
MSLFRKEVLRYWFILIFAKPGNCKSLEQARLSEKLLKEYRKTEKKYPELPHRVLFTNQRLCQELEDKELFDLEKNPQGHLRYWENPKDFRYCPRVDCWLKSGKHKLHDCDIMIDEGGTLFPADKFADTPMWLRKMWAQHRHNGIRIVMLTQSFKNIDINCRRMLWKAYYMQKRIGSRDITPTLPPLKPWTILNFLTPCASTVWGIYTKQEIDPEIMENDPMTMLAMHMSEEKEKNMQEMKLVGHKEMHLITWHKISLYNTMQDVKEFESKPFYHHIAAKCESESCKFEHVTHKLDTDF